MAVKFNEGAIRSIVNAYESKIIYSWMKMPNTALLAVRMVNDGYESGAAVILGLYRYDDVYYDFIGKRISSYMMY